MQEEQIDVDPNKKRDGDEVNLKLGLGVEAKVAI